MLELSDLPHVRILYIAGFVAAFLFVLAGVALLGRTVRDTRRRYESGAAVDMDAIYVNLPPAQLFYLALLCALLAGAFFALASGFVEVGALGAAAGFFLPRLGLMALKRRRHRLFGEQLVDALVNISNSLRAGFSLPQSLELVHREMPNPMSQEMRLVCQELRLGLPIEEALAGLARRMPLPDVDLFVTAVDIVRDVGGNLTEVFDNIAHTIRERHRIEGKIQSLTAQGRLQAIVICLIPFLIAGGMALVAPHILEPLYSTWQGWAAILAGLVFETLGALWIRKIVKIDI